MKIPATLPSGIPLFTNSGTPGQVRPRERLGLPMIVFISLGIFFWGITICLIIRIVTAQMPLLNIDEASFAAAAVRTLDTHSVILDQIRDNKPPGIYIPYWIAFRLGGAYNMSVVHYIGLAYVLSTSLAIAYFARQWGGIYYALITAGIYLLFTSLSLDSLALKTELLMNLPITVCCGLAALGLKRHSLIILFLAGIFGGVAFLFKQPAGIILVLLDLGIAIFAVSSNGIRAATLGLPVMFGIGTIGAIGAVAGLYAVLGNFYSFMLQTFWLSSDLAKSGMIPLTRRLLRAFTYSEEYSGVAQFLCLLALAGAGVLGFIPAARRMLFKEFSSETTTIVLSLAVGCLVAFFSSPDLHYSYFIILFVPIAFCLGAAITLVFIEPVWRLSNPIHRLVLTICCLFSVAFAGIHAAKDPIKTLVDGEKFKMDKVYQALTVNSQPDDKLFVWGWDPNIYVLSKLHPATRFTVPWSVVGIKGDVGRQENRDHVSSLYYEEGSWDVLMRELNEERPRFIEDARKMSYGKEGASLQYYPRLKSLIDSDYEMLAVSNAGGPILYMRRGATIGK